jgi:hypothetical protein
VVVSVLLTVPEVRVREVLLLLLTVLTVVCVMLFV